jgi:hypothetical protein
MADFSKRIKTRDLAEIAGQAGKVGDAFRLFAEDVRRDGLLSSDGHRAKLRKMADDFSLKFLGDQRKAVEERRIQIAVRRAELQPTPPRDDDLRGELQRQELRAHLKTLKNHGERLRLIAERPDFARAAIFAPNELSAIDEDFRHRAAAFLIQTEHGEEIALLDGAEADIKEVETSISITEKEIESEINRPVETRKIYNGEGQ